MSSLDVEHARAGCAPHCHHGSGGRRLLSPQLMTAVKALPMVLRAESKNDPMVVAAGIGTLTAVVTAS